MVIFWYLRIKFIISIFIGALCEPLSCLAHGWDRAGQIPIGDDILVIGAGIIGNNNVK